MINPFHVNELTILEIVEKALRESNDPRINNVSADYDNDSGEIIITVDNGEKLSDWLVTSSLTITKTSD